jgi:threonine dehydrogenase-like Zn-dependent dehydrogenase
MRGVVFLGDRELELREFPDPAPGPGEVVIEMKASRMCGCDLHAYRAPPAVCARTMVPLPEPLSFEVGAAISCGTGTAYAALHRMNLSGAHTLAVFGQGPVGLSATLLADAMGARGLALAKLITERWKLDQAAEAYRLFDRQTTGKGVFTAF